MFYIYILRSNSNQLYVGQTNNLDGREKQQLTKSSKAAKFIKDGKEFYLVYSEQYSTRLESMRREKQLKGWSRAKKESLINRDIEKLKELSKRKKISQHHILPQMSSKNSRNDLT
ncbi:MAG TPA: GIY-YIG nuclease family protein [Patescibacteria group bacterium]|nr:GIY-YIG nuclease family protein [Patescibacteria group bacterium]